MDTEDALDEWHLPPASVHEYYTDYERNLATECSPAFIWIKAVLLAAPRGMGP